MTGLVFSIENIFSTDFDNGCLGQNEVNKFFIAPYQRGYKWASDTKNSPVPLLMQDLNDAFDAYKSNNKKGEYYLQYITVKKNDRGNYLEVIDGQQRLTTLSLLFSCLSLNKNCPNITLKKLSYAIRENVNNFLEQFIFNSEKLTELVNITWNKNGILIDGKEYNEQDIFYLFHAVKKINELLPKNEIPDFYKYVKENVNIIVNLVEPHITSEKVFRNLNSNKVELTNTDLIKGLLLTKTARNKEENIRFKELMEYRATMGRQWDEISSWIRGKEISSFYFSSAIEDAMHKLVELLAIKNNFKQDNNATDDNKYDLFNFFQSKIKKGEKSAKEFFIELKLLFAVLKEWFFDDEIYNLLGFLFFAKGTPFSRIEIIKYFELNRTDLKNELNKKVKEILPKNDTISNLAYGDDDDEIHRLLLSLSVFPSNTDSTRFDFFKFQNNWSLEHIFPQNPDEWPDELGEKDIDLIMSLVENKKFEFTKFITEERTKKDVKTVYAGLKKKLKNSKCSLLPIEKEMIFYMIRTKELNSIGNMALLSSSDNSSNSNGMFDFKRQNIVKRVSEGSFVPKHTYDVFSKLLSKKMKPDLTVWTEEDIKAHSEWIIEKSSMIND